MSRYNFQSGLLFVSIFAALVLMESCGFKLRGSIELPPQFDTIYIEDQNTSAITPALQMLLKRNKIIFVDNLQAAKVIIGLKGERYQRRVLTVSSGGNVEEFELAYFIKYSITKRDTESGKLIELLKGQTVKLKRDLRFNENAVLAKSTEEQSLREDMLNTAAAQIIRRLYKLKNIES